MIKHFNLDIMEKNTNKINIDNYLNLKFKNQDKNYIERQTKRIKYNYELNMKYFESLDYTEFSKYIDEFMKKNKFIEVKDLKNYIGKKGIYVLILDEYKQAYLGLTDRGIKERIKDHWNAKKEPERLIFGQAFNSILSIDSFGALDTTRIFVKLDGPLYEIEYKLVDAFDKRYLLNRTIGGIGSVYTYSDDKYSALAAVMGNSKRRDYTPFINENEFYKQCSKYDIDMYEYRKKNGGIFD